MPLQDLASTLGAAGGRLVYSAIHGGLFRELKGNQYAAFSATDIQATVTLPGRRPYVLGSLVAISISTHRDKFPVTSLSHIGAKGITAGHRMVAGTLMFHTFDRSAFETALVQEYPRERVQPDELPLFDVQMTYVNASGEAAIERVIGISLLDFGRTISLESLNPVESYSYMALDYEPMRSITSPVLPPEDGLVQIIPSSSRRQLLTGDGLDLLGLNVDVFLGLFGGSR